MKVSIIIERLFIGPTGGKEVLLLRFDSVCMCAHLNGNGFFLCLLK